MDIIDLLEVYKKKRDGEIEKLGKHLIEPPADFEGSMKTLDNNFFRPITPMLRKRFEFCSTWKNAYLSQDWLSIKEINNWDSNKILCNWLSLRKDNSYPGEPLEDCPMKNISIFSINPHEPEEIYLVWSDNEIEPKVWHYFGADFYTFNSFERFLFYINGLAGDIDTFREAI